MVTKDYAGAWFITNGVDSWQIDPETINQHDLLSVDGEVLKVVSVEVIAPGAVEIKVVKFARYQA